MPSLISSRCPSCAADFQVELAHVGRTVKCPDCGVGVVVGRPAAGPKPSGGYSTGFIAANVIVGVFVLAALAVGIWLIREGLDRSELEKLKREALLAEVQANPDAFVSRERPDEPEEMPGATEDALVAENAAPVESAVVDPLASWLTTAAGIDLLPSSPEVLVETSQGNSLQNRDRTNADDGLTGARSLWSDAVTRAISELPLSGKLSIQRVLLSFDGNASSDETDVEQPYVAPVLQAIAIELFDDVSLNIDSAESVAAESAVLTWHPVDTPSIDSAMWLLANPRTILIVPASMSAELGDAFRQRAEAASKTEPTEPLPVDVPATSGIVVAGSSVRWITNWLRTNGGSVSQALAASLEGSAVNTRLRMPWAGGSWSLEVDCEDADLAMELSERMQHVLRSDSVPSTRVATGGTTALFVNQMLANAMVSVDGDRVSIVGEIADEDFVYRIGGVQLMAGLARTLSGPSVSDPLHSDPSQPGPSQSGPSRPDVQMAQPPVDKTPVIAGEVTSPGFDGLKVTATVLDGALLSATSDEALPPVVIGLDIHGDLARQAVSIGEFQLDGFAVSGDRRLKRVSAYGPIVDLSREWFPVERSNLVFSHPDDGVRARIAFDAAELPEDRQAVLAGHVRLKIPRERREITVEDVQAVAEQEPDALRENGIVIKVVQDGDHNALKILSPDKRLVEVTPLRRSGERILGATVGIEDVEDVQVCTVTMLRGSLPLGLGISLTLQQAIEVVTVPFRFPGIPLEVSPSIDENAANEEQTVWAETEFSAGIPKTLRVTARAAWPSMTISAGPGPAVDPLAVEVDVEGGAARNAIAVGMVNLRAAVDGDGNRIIPLPAEFQPYLSARRFARMDRDRVAFPHPTDGVRAPFLFKPPEEPTERFGSFEGTFRLLVAGHREVIRVDNVLERDGKLLVHPVLRREDARLSLARRDLQLALARQSDNPWLFESVRCVDAAGRPLTNVHISVGDPADVLILDFVDLGHIPEDIGLEFVLNREVEEIGIPFRFSNLRIPPRDVEQVDAAKTEPPQ